MFPGEWGWPVLGTCPQVIVVVSPGEWGWPVLGTCPQVIVVVSPGEWGWPVLGAWMPSGVTMEDHAKALRQKYGDIFTWRMGSRTMVFLNNFQLIKTAFNNPDLQDRPDFYTFDCFIDFKKTGIFASNGVHWRNSRRFALRQMKDLGMGKSSLMDAIQYEATCLVEDFSKHTGHPTVLPRSLDVSVLNVIWRLISDIRYNVDDPKIHEFSKLMTDSLGMIQGPALLFDMFPWLLTVAPTFIEKLLGVDADLRKISQLKDFTMQVIEEHEASLDPDKPRDYIDIYLVEMKTQQDNPESTMDKRDLNAQLVDLFAAGSETTTQTLRWAIMYLAKYPDIQTRVQRQIDDVVPRGTLPSLQDKPKLPYLVAVIQEVNRVVSLSPLGVTHFAAADTQLAGYTIPKGTVVIANLEMCHKDPTYWEKPDEFYPEHFLDSEGKLKPRKENYLPFSIGTRACPGEPLARMELYLFLSALLQNFTFSAPEGEDIDLQKDPSNVLINFPKPNKVVIIKRTQNGSVTDSGMSGDSAGSKE
ncbi:cytochrome P450 2L1-like isoform X2 [Homarus americanus]|uniref:cytochrome P450 2L1-like isoform X2 n=1 Tax=Homarus americanus TaxID=6706 RepID=UPI001C4693D4|nr:cytochrome P450 2L1-like isoform X2 [Homarus americanus]